MTVELGAPVAVYRRYPRGQLALASGALAGLLSLLSYRVDGTLLVPILGLAASGLLGSSLSYALDLLPSGKDVAVYEHGVALGRTRLAWTEIERVQYSRDGGSRVTGSERQTHRLEFHLRRSRKREVLMLGESSISRRLDVSELLQLLSRAGVAVEDESAPRLSRDESPVPSGEPDDALARPLSEDIAQTLSQIDASGLTPACLSALREGEHQRDRIARRHRLLSLGLEPGTYALVLMIRLLGLLVILAGICTLAQVAALFGASFTLLDTLGFPGGILRYLALAGLLVGALWSAGRLEDVAKELRKARSRRAAIASSLRRAAQAFPLANLLDGLARREPFALYLRSFQTEYFQYLESVKGGGSDDDFPYEFEARQRDFDTALISRVAPALPVFGLANIRDASVPQALALLVAPDEQWLRVACELIVKAEAVILYLSASTLSVLAEVEILRQLQAQRRTFIVRREETGHAPISGQHGLLQSFPHQVSDGSLEWEGALSAFLRGRGLQPNSS